ncbi:unnamed protein product [Prunus armeniaca]
MRQFEEDKDCSLERQRRCGRKEWVDDQTKWTDVKETGNEATTDWPTDVELDYEDSECKYNFEDEADKN